MNESVTRKITRAMMALLLAATVCGYPFVCAKKAEAFAPAVGAAAAAGALAAELGITTEALMTGLAVVTAAGTGVYLLNSSDYATSAVSLNDTQWRNLWDGTDLGSGYEQNWAPEYQKWKLGNGKTWEDLTPEERQNWSSPAEYDQAQLLGYALETGLISEVAGGGGYEPTPEPDPEQDPEGHARWQKARNVLATLGVGTGVVALNDAVGWLGDTLGNGIHDLLFGSDGFGLTYTSNYMYGDMLIQFAVAGPFKQNALTWQPGVWASCYYHAGTNEDTYTVGRWDGVYGDGVVRVERYGTSGMRLWGNGSGSKVLWTNHGSTTVKTTTTASGSPVETYTDSSIIWLNAQFSGKYTFPDGATYQSGAWTVEPQNPPVVEYPTIADTPQQLKDSITNNNSWNTYLNNATVPAEGQTAGLTLPTVMPSTYPGLITVVEDSSQIVPIPDDRPIYEPLPEPAPAPEPSPGVPEDFQDNMDDSVERIMRNPLDQLFPFCLIADFRDFVFIFLGGRTDTQRLHANSLTTQSDTDINELNGVHNLRIDASESFGGFVVDIPLDPVHDLLDYARTPLTILMTMYLVYESFKFFLFRGGE